MLEGIFILVALAKPEAIRNIKGINKEILKYTPI